MCTLGGDWTGLPANDGIFWGDWIELLAGEAICGSPVLSGLGCDENE